MLFTAALTLCAAGAALCSIMPWYHCIHEWLCRSPTLRASLLQPALSFPLAKPALTRGCSHCLHPCLPASLSAAAPARRAVCHRPSLPAALLAKDMQRHSCLPPLLQSCRFGLLCTLLMSSSCRDLAPHRRSKWAETSTRKIIAMRAIRALSCLESAYMACVTATAHRSSNEMQLAIQLGDRQQGRHRSSD